MENRKKISCLCRGLNSNSSVFQLAVYSCVDTYRLLLVRSSIQMNKKMTSWSINKLPVEPTFCYDVELHARILYDRNVPARLTECDTPYAWLQIPLGSHTYLLCAGPRAQDRLRYFSPPYTTLDLPSPYPDKPTHPECLGRTDLNPPLFTPAPPPIPPVFQPHKPSGFSRPSTGQSLIPAVLPHVYKAKIEQHE